MAPGLFGFVHRDAPPQFDGTRDPRDPAADDKAQRLAEKLANMPGFRALQQRNAERAERAVAPKPVEHMSEQPVNEEPLRDIFDGSILTDTHSTIVSEAVPLEDEQDMLQQPGILLAFNSRSASHASDQDDVEPQNTIDDAAYAQTHKRDFNGEYQDRYGVEYRAGKPHPTFHHSAIRASDDGIRGQEVMIEDVTYTRHHQNELVGDYQKRQQADPRFAKPQSSHRRPASRTSGGDVPEVGATIDNATRVTHFQHDFGKDHQSEHQVGTHHAGNHPKRTINGNSKKSKSRGKNVEGQKLQVPEMNVPKPTSTTVDNQGAFIERKELPPQQQSTGCRTLVDKYHQPTNKRHHAQLDLDHDPATLHQMEFHTLQEEPFDMAPGAELPVQEGHDPLWGLFEPSLTPQARHDLLSSMSAQQWLEMGQELIERFAKITEELIHSRHNRRQIAMEYENEVARRHEEAIKHREELKEVLDEMKQQGDHMVGVTPKSKKRGIFQA